ncbi:MAG: Ni/Fe-hydrogenase, b-type cytochrome subunit [Helicobacteraceae bacterium]|nr:Ni/Fe-hydrogenase, b-type cytochrome subunit [Helicobacteraceae bacterium]
MKEQNKTFKRSLTFTPIVRFFHWIRAFCIFFLIFSGFYIAYPFLSPEPNTEPTNFLYALFRSWHIMVGFLLISVSIFRLYLFLADGRNKNERMSVSDLFNIKIWIGQIKNYLFLGPHPYIKGVYNPLQFFSYFFLAVLVLIISLTGVILYYNVYHNGLGGILFSMFKWLEVALGGLANVRMIHHIVTWIIIIFIPIHIYMAVWNAVKHPDGGVDSIVGGFRYQESKN